MKQAKILIAFIMISSFFISCKKDSGGKNNNLPDPVNKIISQSIIDSLQNHGMIINAGKTPPVVDGIYQVSQITCTYDNSGGYSPGDVIDDYKFKFTNETVSDFTIRVDYKDISFSGTDSGSDVSATYIAGSGNDFTIFASINGNENGVSYNALSLYSGTLSGGNIQNFQESFYLKSKSQDPSGEIADVGTLRIFNSNNVEPTTTYAVPVFLNQNGNLKALMMQALKKENKLNN